MKKNVASQSIGAQMITAADGTAFTGSVTVYVTGDAGTQAVGSVGSGACTHEGNGFHTYAPAQAETNYDHIAFTFIGTGAIPSTVQVFTTFPQTGDSFARLGAPAGASVSADIATIDTNVDAILVDTGTTLPASIATAQADLDTITGSDGVTLATTQGNYAPSVAGDAMTLTAAATSAQLVDDVWDEVLSGATHNVASSAGRRLRSLQDNGLYALASVWVDEVGGASTGTVAYEDATVTNRSNDFDNAQTVADAINIQSIQITNGNSITLTAGLEGYNVFGNASTLALGGQNIGGSVFRQFGSVTGIGTTTANPVFFEDCIFGAVTIPPCTLQRVSFGGTLTIGSAGDFQFRDCSSAVAGSGAPVLDMGAAVGATTVSLRRWSGGLTINNMAAGDVVSVDVVSGGTITINGTGGTVVVRGHCNVVDGSSGSVSITETSVVNMTKINTEVDTAISDAALATAAALATVDANVDAILVDTGTTIPAQISGLNNLSAAQVNAECDTAISDAALATAANLATVDTVVDAIKAKTDSLTFTKANEVDSNVQSINGVTITGDGSATPFDV